MTSWILKLTISFWSSYFFYMTKKSRQKVEYLENEKSFSDEIKSTFQKKKKVFIRGDKTIFLEGESPILRNFLVKLNRQALARNSYSPFKTGDRLFSNIAYSKQSLYFLSLFFTSLSLVYSVCLFLNKCLPDSNLPEWNKRALVQTGWRLFWNRRVPIWKQICACFKAGGCLFSRGEHTL